MVKDPDLLSIEDERPLTRADVARLLGVSVSTVRRWQKQGRLRSTQGADGVHEFRPADVAALRETIMAEAKPQKKAARTKQAAAKLGRWAGRTPGELAGQLLMAFEKRWSLSEIVAAYDVPVAEVREHYNEWLLGLDKHEREQRPVSQSGWAQTTLPKVPSMQAARVLLAMPESLEEPMRLSVGRVEDRYDEKDGEPYDGVRWLPGFTTSSRVELSELWQRYGVGDFLLYAFDADGSQLWAMQVPVSMAHAVVCSAEGCTRIALREEGTRTKPLCRQHQK